MTEEYITNFENTISNILFISFKWIVIFLTILLIFSLIMLDNAWNRMLDKIAKDKIKVFNSST